MSAPPFPEPPPAYPGSNYQPQQFPNQQPGPWYPPPNQTNYYQGQQQPQQFGGYAAPGYPQPYPGGPPYGTGQPSYPYPQQPGYPVQQPGGYPGQQPYPGGYQQPQSVVVVKGQQPTPARSGPSAGDCCLIALCAMCCACCLAEAMD